MRIPNQILNASYISRLLGNDFEAFCRVLIDYERHYRHHEAELEGPTRQYVGDQGCDLLLTVFKTPRVPRGDFEGALTEDDLGKTANLCKTGDGYKDALIGDCRKPIPLDVASGGGWVIAFVNIQLSTPERDDLRDGMIDELAEQLSVDRDLVADRVKVKDANDLHTFYSYHPLDLNSQVRAVLAIPDLDGLMYFEEWRQYFAAERFWPEFASDTARDESIKAMGALFGRISLSGDEPTCIWLYGPPGVGKSRLVAEAIAPDPSFGQRALVARDKPIRCS